MPLRCKVLPSECCLRFGAWLLVPLQGACCKVLLSGSCFGSCLLVPLQGRYEVFGALFGFWSFTVPLQGAELRCCCHSAVCALELGCSAGCCFQGAAVKVFGAWRWRVPLQGSAAGCCGQRYWVLVPLQGAGVGALFGIEKTFKCCPQIFFAIGVYAGVFFSKGLKA